MFCNTIIIWIFACALQAFNSRWQVVVFYSGDWEENSLSAIMAFSSLAADFR